MEFLFGVIGLILGVILGTGFLYWFQTRKLGSLHQRLAQTRTALEQTELLNKQQASQIKALLKEKTKSQDSEAYYQNKFAEFEDREKNYQARIEELENDSLSQHKTEDLSPGSVYTTPQPEYEKLQQEHENILAEKTQELELAYEERIEQLRRSHQEQIEELSGALNALQSSPDLNSAEPVSEDNDIIHEEPWKATQSSWMDDNELTNSALMNPFLSNDPQPAKAENPPSVVPETKPENPQSVNPQNIDDEEMDLAGLLASEGGNELLQGFDQNFKTSFSSENQPPETNSEEVDLLAMLESEGMNLKQASDSTQQQEEELPDLFNDIEASSNEIEDFLGMLKQESESNSLSMDKNGHKSMISPLI